MKKADIKVGSVYRAKVSDKLTDVRIDAEHPGGGWNATNLATKKKVRIKSAQRPRAPAMTAERAKAVAAADQENARLRQERTASKDGQTASERAMSSPPRKSARAKTASPAKPVKAAAGGKPGGDSKAKARTGILDVAAQILAKAREAMRCKGIVEQAIAKGLWSTSGKTPHATLYAAIIREIADKGKDARFEKVDRGQFRIRSGKGA